MAILYYKHAMYIKIFALFGEDNILRDCYVHSTYYLLVKNKSYIILSTTEYVLY